VISSYVGDTPSLEANMSGSELGRQCEALTATFEKLVNSQRKSVI